MMTDEHVVKMYNEVFELNKALRQRDRLKKKVERTVRRLEAARAALDTDQANYSLSIDVYVTLRTKAERAYGQVRG